MTNLPIGELIKFPYTNPKQILQRLWSCRTVEHQFIDLREIVQLDEDDIDRRTQLVQWLIDCFNDALGIYVEGSVFGSSVNGLGFKDSDIDLVLRVGTSDDKFKLAPKTILKRISDVMPKLLPGSFIFVNSKRCPIVKIQCSDGKRKRDRGNYNCANIDVSITHGFHLALHNSKCIRFLCQLEPKFHLLAIVVRYWSKSQDLIVPGCMSSYAMISMVIMFCQMLETPLLPSFDTMRDKAKNNYEYNGWNCSICMDLSSYKRSENQQKLSILLLRFFEMYLNFDYASDYVNIRSGRCISKVEFSTSPYQSESFKFNDFLSVQDPFELNRNLTGGMNRSYFERFLIVLRWSYNTLHNQLMTCSLKPIVANDWGLNSIFIKFTPEKTQQEGTSKRKTRKKYKGERKREISDKNKNNKIRNKK